MVVKQDRARELAHLVETPLRPCLLGYRNRFLLTRPLRLPARHHDAADQAQDDERRGDRRGRVAPDELARAVGQRVAARQHGQRFQVTANVIGELLD